jgi:hypothetical protein
MSAQDRLARTVRDYGAGNHSASVRKKRVAQHHAFSLVVPGNVTGLQRSRHHGEQTAYLHSHHFKNRCDVRLSAYDVMMDEMNE